MIQSPPLLSRLTELQITSEIGRLRRVILHHPQAELELMTPSNHDSLLFDDILFLQEAQKEHLIFEQAMTALGIEVLRLEALLTEALPHETGTPLDWREMPNEEVYQRWDIEALLHKLMHLHQRIMAESTRRWMPHYYDKLHSRLREVWQAKGAPGLARALIEGFVATPDMVNFYDDVAPFLMAPIPNMLFMRDPAAIVGRRAIISSMAKPARRRESLVLSFIFEALCHYDVQQGRPIESRFWFDPFNNSEDRRDEKWAKVEGGDVLVIHDRILFIGLSERTTREMIRKVAQRFMGDEGGSGIEVVYAALMPMQRAAMHLDTVFTMASEDECMIYPPMMHPEGIDQVQIVRLAHDSEGGFQVREQPSLIKSLQADLHRYTGNEYLTLTPIFCGGEHIIDQDREQWGDGANLLALAPGVVIGYDRNARTFETLRAHGYHVVRAQELLNGSERAKKLCEEIRATMDSSVPGAPRPTRRHKYAIAIPGAELSRARGGPRCMSMPLYREPVRWNPKDW